MANTYTQLFIQIIFAVQGRTNLIRKDFNDEVYKYITGIITNKGQKLLQINGIPDHVHIFIRMNPDISISDLVQMVKQSSTNFINSKKWINGKFNWQKGFGAFSYSKSQADNVKKYIQNQENHHKKQTFKEEYIDFLKKFEVEYDEKYLFEWIDYNKE